MSKRFGRNQRRRAREALAASQALAGELAVKSSFQESSLNAAASRIRLLEEQLDIAKRTIGRHHPAFPAQRLDMGFFPAPGDHFAFDAGPRDIATMAMMTITTNRNTAFNEVHFHLRHGEFSAAYAISDNAMRNVPEGILCDAITKELVDYTISEYRKVKAGGRS